MNKPLKIPAQVLQEQFASSNPSASAWVAANAGSGKTHVLTQRVIRLMLEDNPPDKILCLTFTKAAAANMKSRVFDTLAKWTMMEDAVLDEAIVNLSGVPASPKIRNRARCLFAQALDTPGGLKIQTIHAFCESLLHQFPLEANVPGHFETLQEIGQASLLEDAKAYVLSGNDETGHVAEHFRALIGAVTPDAIERGITAIVSRRSEFLSWIKVGIEPALSPIFNEFDVQSSDTQQTIFESTIKNLPIDENLLKAIAEISGESDKSTDQQAHIGLTQFFQNTDPAEKFELLESIVLTKGPNAKCKKAPITKFVKDRIPDAADALVACGEALLAAHEKLNALMLLENSRHLFHIAEAVLARYEGLKRARGLIDFDDQVEKCATLLNRSEIREWIRYRLDRGIDHVLVDEAQDTSPKQWEIINAITADFHAGETAAVKNRTVFVVGDEKQSIYSFQGAKPAEFAHQQNELEKAVNAAQKGFHPGKLLLSFRSTKDVLHAVDLVFKGEDNRRGLTQSGEEPIHDAVRSKDPGEVQVWPLFVKEKVEDPESWLDPVDRTNRSDPAVQLAERIADAIGEWVGRTIPGMEAPLKYSDILVLVRKRDRFITALTRTMKDKGLKVAGADRLVLTDHIAVEDLLALGQFVVLPQDDLNLAGILKGPLFDLSEEELFDLAHGREENTLHRELWLAADDNSHTSHALAVKIRPALELLLKQGRELDVFEFYAWVLGPYGMRKAFLARLGMEAEDVLDAFVEETIAFMREGGIGLESFIGSLNRAKPEIKREVELDRDEVRILTVHASKGLEARVVFLVDPCNAPWTEKHRPPILPVNAGNKNGMLWLHSSEFHVEATRESTDELRIAAEEEYRRLLYVGMTRAADRLVVCGFRGTNEPKFTHWYSMVSDALSDTATELFDKNGNAMGMRWTSGSSTVEDKLSDALQPVVVPETPTMLPDWLTKPAPHEKSLPSPLTPTGAYAMIDTLEEAGQANVFQEKIDNPTHALQRGKAVHKLLELLPEIEASGRAEVGQNYLANVGADWSPDKRISVWRDVKSIMGSDKYSHLFSDKSSAEVSLSGKLQTRTGERLIAGQIDRLVVEEDRISIVDYKTNAVIPDDIRAIPPQYITQMALYRELISQIYKDHDVECHILWVHGPEMMQIPEPLLSSALEEIKKI